MTSNDPTPPWENVFVRHVVASKRGDFDRVEPLLNAPFETNSSTSSSGIEAINRVPKPSHRWMVAAHFLKLPWVPLYSNVATAEQVFQANRNSRRLQVVWVGRRPDDSEMLFQLVSAREQVVCFNSQAELGKDDWRSYQCSDVELDQALSRCNSAIDAFDRLCNHFEIRLPYPWIHDGPGHYEVIGAKDKPIMTGMGDYRVFSADGIAPGENDAAERLARAIERGKPKGVRAAIAAGAPLDVLPETSLTPLVKAILQCGCNRKWKDCAQALVDAGCCVNGDAKRDSVIFDACQDFMREEKTIEILKFLIENGVDLNQRGSGRLTVLDSAACSRREKVVQFLIDNGADPNVLTRGDKSIIDEMRTRVEKDLKHSSASQYERVLRILTSRL